MKKILGAIFMAVPLAMLMWFMGSIGIVTVLVVGTGVSMFNTGYLLFRGKI